MKSKFTCRVQQTKHDELEAEHVGEIDHEAFLHRFRTTEWELESQRSRWVDKAWPGIEVINNINGARLWVSAYLATWDWMPNVHQLWFLVGSENIPLPPRIVSMREGHMQTPYPEDIECLFQHFFNEDFVSLIGEFAQLARFDE